MMIGHRLGHQLGQEESSGNKPTLSPKYLSLRVYSVSSKTIKSTLNNSLLMRA